MSVIFLLYKADFQMILIFVNYIR